MYWFIDRCDPARRFAASYNNEFLARIFARDARFIPNSGGLELKDAIEVVIEQ
jgi:hypothetical protein